MKVMTGTAPSPRASGEIANQIIAVYILATPNLLGGSQELPFFAGGQPHQPSGFRGDDHHPVPAGLSYRLRVSQRAESQIRVAADWWLENREGDWEHPSPVRSPPGLRMFRVGLLALSPQRS